MNPWCHVTFHIVRKCTELKTEILHGRWRGVVFRTDIEVRYTLVVKSPYLLPLDNNEWTIAQCIRKSSLYIDNKQTFLKFSHYFHFRLVSNPQTGYYYTLCIHSHLFVSISCFLFPTISNNPMYAFECIILSVYMFVDCVDCEAGMAS